MVVTLDIGRVQPGLYQAHCEGALDGPTHHISISEALAYYGTSIPSEFAKFVDPRYGGVSLGTTAVADLASKPAALAAQLAALVALVFNT